MAYGLRPPSAIDNRKTVNGAKTRPPAVADGCKRIPNRTTRLAMRSLPRIFKGCQAIAARLTCRQMPSYLFALATGEIVEE